MARRKLTATEAVALNAFLEITADALLSMLLDHGTECVHHQTARTLLELAGWDEDRLAAVIIERCFL